jgi:hypothetical protein
LSNAKLHYFITESASECLLSNAKLDYFITESASVCCLMHFFSTLYCSVLKIV